jgi:hypothetical protein
MSKGLPFAQMVKQEGTLATYVSRMGVGRVSKSSVHIILR